MARLQILELPTEHHGDDMVTPWLLVIDQVDDGTAADIARWPDDIAKRTGARHVLCFTEAIDIPVNETPVDPDGYPLKFRVEGDFKTFRAQVQEEISKAQGELARAINQDAVWNRTGIARDTEQLAKWKIQILDALGMNHSRDWDDIRNTAYGIRKQRDARGAAIERVRQIHFMRLQDDRHEDTGICAADADDWPCSTVRALDFIQADAQGSQPDA